MAKRRKKTANKRKAARKKAPKKRPSASIMTASVRPVKTASQIKKEYKPHYTPFEGMKKRKGKHMIVGLWALIIAVLASIILALVETPYLVLALVVVGFVVGFLNFEHEETVKFLVATASLLIVASAVLLSGFSRLEIVMPVVALYLRTASYNVIAVVAPAALVLSLKALRELAD